MASHGCPTCAALHELLVDAEPDVVRRGVEARARGPGFGVLVAVPEALGAETPEEAAALEAAREQGYFVGVMSVDALIRFVPAEGHDPEAITDILRQAGRPPPQGQVHVLGALEGCVAAVTARANPEIVAARDREAERVQRIGALLALGEPEVLRRAAEASRRPGTVFVVVAPDEPAVGRLRGVTAEACAAARAGGVYVGLHDAADAIAALPLEGLEAEDGLRATRRLTAPIPDGSVRVVAVNDGHITFVTSRAAPGCLALK